MKTNLYLITGAMTFLLATPLAMADEGHSHGMQHQKAANTADAPTQALMAYADAIASESVDEMANYVAADGKDFTIFEGSGANYGWSDYRDHHLAPEFANPDLTFHTYKYNDIITQSAGDVAFSTFSIEMAYTYKGEDKSKTGRGTAILKRFGDTWKIVHLHTS